MPRQKIYSTEQLKAHKREYMKRYNEEHRDELNAYHREYYKRKKGVENETISNGQ